jgi:GcrA cell cycle regulator
MRADDAWTDDRIAILKQMWADGAPASAIAARLGGLSRSAVLGKIHRLRFGRAAPAAMKVQAAEAPQKSATLERRRPARDRAPPPSLQPQSKESGRRGKSLLELTNDSCRWPNGDPAKPNFFYCGAPGADLENGRPYCAHHARRAYSGAADADDGGSPVISVRNSPSIAPADTPRGYVWRAPVKHPAPRWK